MWIMTLGQFRHLRKLLIFHSIFFEYFSSLSRSWSHAETCTNTQSSARLSRCAALLHTLSCYPPYLLPAACWNTKQTHPNSLDSTLHSQTGAWPHPLLYTHPVESRLCVHPSSGSWQQWWLWGLLAGILMRSALQSFNLEETKAWARFSASSRVDNGAEFGDGLCGRMFDQGIKGSLGIESYNLIIGWMTESDITVKNL